MTGASRLREPDAKHKDSPPEERLNEIGRLLKQCEYVIHAGDPDEEGQLLIDEVLRWFHYKGKAYRLDTLDLTEAGMRRALKSLTDNRLHEKFRLVRLCQKCRGRHCGV